MLTHEMMGAVSTLRAGSKPPVEVWIRLPAALMMPSTCSTAALRCFQVALPRSEISLPAQLHELNCM